MTKIRTASLVIFLVTVSAASLTAPCTSQVPDHLAITYPQTPAEASAGITPSSYRYPPGNILRYSADPTGVTDVSTALTRAAAVSDSVTVPPGKYLLNGTATVALRNVSIECHGSPPSANTPPPYGTTGAVFRLTSTTVQPFTIADGVRISNCIFFWPNQTGRSPSPTAYPPLFTEPSGAQISNFDLINDRVINAYDVFNANNANDSIGAITLTDTSGYAIHYWLSLANVPETVTIRGMIADWNLYQNAANAGPNRYLANWTAANGVFLHVFGNGNGTSTASTVSVAGVLFSGSVFAYNKFIWVDSTGSLSESVLSGIVDAVPRVLQIDSGGCASQVKINALYFAYQWNPTSPGPGGKDHAPAFSISSPTSGFAGCTLTSIILEGSLSVAQGDVLALNGSYIKSIGIHLSGNGQYAKTSTPGTYYFASINGSSVILDAFGNHVEPGKPDMAHRGFNIQNCYQCTITGNSFNGVYDPISIANSNIPVSGSGNISSASPSGSSIVGTGTFAHRLLLGGNSWDALASPTLTLCGTGPEIIGNDAIGVIVVGKGTVTTCTLTFAQAYAAGPNCSFTPTVNTPVSLSSISASAVTITSGRNNVGDSHIYYQCQP